MIDDYRTAIDIGTGEPRFLHFGPPSRRRKAGSLTPRKTMVIDQEIPVGQGQQVLLRDLAITAEGGILRYRRRLDAPGSSQVARLFGFELELEVAPNVLAAGALDELPVAWWARDDRENHYLGGVDRLVRQRRQGAGDDALLAGPGSTRQAP